MLRRWLGPVLLAIFGVAVTARQIATGSPVAAAVSGLVFAILAAALSPWYFPRHSSAADAQRRSATDGRAIVYWRPGCPYCLRLRTTMGRQARKAHWVNIWRDPDGAAAVRAVADGNETVPTVVLAGQVHVNPDPTWLRGQLLAIR